MTVTVSGIWTSVKLAQYWNILSGISVSPWGKTTVSNAESKVNRPSPSSSGSPKNSTFVRL